VILSSSVKNKKKYPEESQSKLKIEGKYKQPEGKKLGGKREEAVCLTAIKSR